MAMRQRGSGYSTDRPRQTNRPIYEDFQPIPETKEEKGDQILTFRLPGFLKEQIKLTAVHYPRIIRIQGVRPLGNNKWSRLIQTFPIPPGCDVSKVHSKFNNGVLTVFLPKVITTETSQQATEKSKTTTDRAPSTSKTDANSDQQKAQNVQDDEKQQKDERNVKASLFGSQKVGVAEPNEAKDQEGKTIDHPLKNVDDQQKEQKGQQKGDAFESSSNKTDEKAKDQSNKDLNEAKLNIEDRGINYLQEKERIMKKDKESSAAAEPKADITTTKVVEKENEKGNKFEIIGTTTKDKQIKELSETSILDKKAEKNMKKGEGEKDEERQTLIINIGAAVLVLVSFGVYVSYSLFGSFGKTKNA